MDYIAQRGMASFPFDSRNDLPESVQVMRYRIALVGNFNNPVTLLNKGSAEVRQEVHRTRKAGVQLLGPECTIPLTAATENLKEIPKAAQ